ncbi:MAG: zinc-dependent alcohol dehydrogenase family protein [Prosthecobacter sp.]|uniref:zinc-dependent alcohol dehydrogenase family protein n=1 Tax=Prosthecobacter sp. TaxID=1965333 RepID=UPI0025FD3382|nr:zinc-dependent alcohol dehydrogenase family protein [Prosthecobacter sp.]MCF7786906.1 zinc-dependent alcohol dehydrogenase family protein [Prosthecobacter sp.]
MNALVYHGPGKKALQDMPKPVLKEATDAIVRITKTTICGTDLHILKGDVPTVTEGRILGHEGIGIIEETGTSVTRFRKGDRVIISCITSCAKCEYCRRGMSSHCEQGGWVLGNTIDGTQAEFVRIPWADTSLHHIPEHADDECMVLLSDILPTGYECGVLNGCVKPGDTVAIIGAGPVGLATLLTAKLYAPADIIMIDVDEHRLDTAKHLGATKLIDNSDGRAMTKIMTMTYGRGVDVAIEAVGIPATFNLCQTIIAPGGHIANVGVHGEIVPLHLETLWSQNITITTRLVDAVTTQLLLKTIMSGKLQPKQLISHRFMLGDVMSAYETFGNAANERALKIILTNE